MMTWAQINDEISTLLDDAALASYPEPLRLTAFNRAQDYFAVTHTAKILRVELTTTPAPDDMVKATLPADMIEIAGVKGNEAWLRPARFVPGQQLDADAYIDNVKEILVRKDLAPLTLWYYARYTPLASPTDTTELPLWSQWAVINLAIAYILIPHMIGNASLRRFQTRREAGDPTDNPSRTQAEFHLKQYHAMVSNYKPQERDYIYEVG